MTFPLVDKNDDGIRPAGKPDECFYCRQKVGTPHNEDCVCVTRLVEVELRFRIEVEIPYSWDQQTTEFHLNGSTSCANNRLEDLVKFADVLTDAGQCMCPRFEGLLIKTVRSTPERKLREVVP